MSPARYAELMGLCNAATPGPWRQVYGYNNGGCPTAFLDVPGHQGGVTVEMHAADAVFIAESRTALPEALDRILELQALVNAFSLLVPVEQVPVELGLALLRAFPPPKETQS